jgi:hypothetical protein
MRLGIDVSSHFGLRDGRGSLTTEPGSPMRIARRSFAGVLALGAALAASSSSCGGRNENRPKCSSVAYNENTLASCATSIDCPAGTTCSQRGQCVTAVFPEIDESVLILGFAVPEIEFHRDQTVTGTVAFEATLTSEVLGLACSLFVAEPVVTGGNVGSVENAPVAIYGSHVFRIDSASSSSLHTVQFGIGDLTATAADKTCPSSPLASLLAAPKAAALTDLSTSKGPYPIVSTLRVGCIGYGAARVVGATRLREVALADLPEAQELLTDCSGQEQSGNAGRLCMAPETLGYCAQGVCEPAGPKPGMASDSPDSAVSSPDIDADAGIELAGVESPQPTPVSDCNACNEGQLCAQEHYFIGRCVGSRCAQVTVWDMDLPLVVSDCAAPFEQTIGLNCYDSQVAGYGTCLAKTCRARCVVSDDCTATYGQSSTVDPICAHPRASPTSAPGYLGLCLPRAWFDETASMPAAGDAGVCGANSPGADSASLEPGLGKPSDHFCVAREESRESACN